MSGRFGTSYTMKPAITFRTELYPDGSEVRRKRQAVDIPPEVPRPASGLAAFLFICPITKHYVVAAKADGRLVGRRHVVCYMTFKDRKAAIMYALAVGG